jgi:amidase
MHVVKSETFIYAFSKNNKPVLEVDSGSTVQIETYDCFQNQIQAADATFNSIDWNQINPASGPVFVRDAVPGDILKVKIEKIELADQGVIAVGPGLGVMGGRIENFEVKIIPIRDGKAHFNEIEIPLNPMIGVIGVAPEEGEINCGTPGAHGGNMDNKMIAEGATLYFPVHAEGALFALGDLHAAMGDGEIGVSGIEIPAHVTVTLEVIKGHTLKHPFLENEESASTIVSALTLDEAVKESVHAMVDLLLPQSKLSLNQLTMLLSATGQTEICQVVDPLMTARFVLPKWVLKELNISLFN